PHWGSVFVGQTLRLPCRILLLKCVWETVAAARTSSGSIQKAAIAVGFSRRNFGLELDRGAPHRSRGPAAQYRISARRYNKEREPDVPRNQRSPLELPRVRD